MVDTDSTNPGLPTSERGRLQQANFIENQNIESAPGI
jgi:hypothetical protein